jgi:inosine-uridine nucleoside N-ribohydrolase
MSATGIGFIPLSASAAETTRRAARATLTELADKEGVALLHVYEAPGIEPDQMRAATSALRDIAARCGARTLVILGALTEEIVALGRSAEMRLIAIPDPAHRRLGLGAPTAPDGSPTVASAVRTGRCPS